MVEVKFKKLDESPIAVTSEGFPLSLQRVSESRGLIFCSVIDGREINVKQSEVPDEYMEMISNLNKDFMD